MRTLLKSLAALLVLALGAVGFRSWQVSQPLFDETVSEAPAEAFSLVAPEIALTLARTVDGRPLLVTAMDRARVQAVDLGEALGLPGAEPLELFRREGYDALAALGRAPSDPYPWAALGVPFELGGQPIAAGTNFQAHAEETGLEDGPFLFPKLSEPTSWQASVKKRPRLDYEVELCAVTIDPMTTGQGGRFAYSLCNDFTDRWALLSGIDLDQPLGRTGFPAAKGGAGLFPVGALLLVPRGPGFHQAIDLGLSVNGRLRQRGSARVMIWPPERIVQEALALTDAPFLLPDRTVRLTAGSPLPAGTPLLLGTPEGVAFQLPNIWMAGAFLKAGDEVLAWGTHLGRLENRITKGS
jgi:2-keto-4-pentenoate hydratase/2-oxohepta-3-ene-1,7-dioic acid hydratase in catechol pathway